MKDGLNATAWEKLFDKYKILELVNKKGVFRIDADQIKEYREPRLMTKFDTQQSLPDIFRKNKLGILPDTRGSYVIGNFNLYNKFPDRMLSKEKVKIASIPSFIETLDINQITSESNAINAMSISSILTDFLDEKQLVPTISGKMASGKFSFYIHGEREKKHIINVERSQMEIDGGFEGTSSVALIEAKNIIHDDFLIRQLYYPFRTWKEKLNKRIRPVFLVYSNNLFRLLEYEFEDYEDYNSIKLLREGFYTLERDCIHLQDIISIEKEVREVSEPENVPFPQADSFDKVVSIIEHLQYKSLTKFEIEEMFGFTSRQADYYFNAAKYLGLIDEFKNSEGILCCNASELGRRILEHPYKQRQLIFADAILQHKVFREVFNIAVMSEEFPDKRYIQQIMKKYKVCSDNLLERRASTVKGWIQWILKLVND